MAFIPPQNGFMSPGDIPVLMSIDYTILFITVIASIILFARSYHYSFERINRELQERIKAEKKLSENEKTLKEKNEELNRSNLEMARINEELMVAKDKAEESDRLKTAFIQNISHEIRTPLNGIVGFVELLQQADNDHDKKTQYVEIINSCTQQLTTLVNDFIDISKLESGTLELHISEFQTNQIIRDLDVYFSRQAKEKDLSFTLINEIGNITIKSDRDKIKQAIDNLVSNAIKFTSEGSVKVTIKRLDDNMVTSVADTGIGIRESDKAIIFDRFRQAEIGLSRPYGGSGLGLAITRGNVEFLGGKIWFESAPDKGSVFTFSVPVEFIA
jgi:signal transduction histidine kinase